MAEVGKGGIEGTSEMEGLTGEVAEIIAKKSGVGKTNIYYLLAVKDKRPDLYEKVFDGSYSIGKAYTQMKRDEAPPTTEEERQEELEANGIRDAIKCTPAFTVISGHQRLRIAKDLGLTEVPVEIIDVDEWEAEYLLIAENVERRGVAEQDAIKKARIAQFLKEYWGIKQGSRSDLVENQRSMKDVAETIGESEWSTRQILKLNKLIPQLQMMVSNGKLSQTNAQELALLTEETQSALYDALGEEIGERTVAETKQLRQEANGKSADEIQAMLAEEKKAKEQDEEKENK